MGTDGQTTQKTFGNLDQARRALDSKVRAKIAKGYTKVEMRSEEDRRARIPLSFLAQAGINGPDVHIEPEGNGPNLCLCNSSASSHTVLATIPFNNPAVLYLPLTLLQSFDLSKPLYARIMGQEVVIKP